MGKGPVAPLVAQPGGKVLMKAGRGLAEIKEALAAAGRYVPQIGHGHVPSAVQMGLDRVRRFLMGGVEQGLVPCTDWERMPENVGYFATVIVKEES